MQDPRSAARSQRLSLFFRAAGTLFALPAVSVLEVAQPSSGEGERKHNGLPVEDLAALLREPPSRAETAVTLVLDAAPPRALLVDEVEEVVDTSGAAFFQLPARSAVGVPGLVRGALVHKGRVALELEPAALSDLRPEAVKPAKPRVFGPAGDMPMPDRALVFVVGGGRRFGAPLPLVTGVLSPPHASRLPLGPFGLRSVVHHEGTLLPVYDLSFMLGGPRTQGPFAVVLEINGAAVAAAASQVVGVLEGFAGDGSPELGGVGFRGRDGREVFFPEYERWF